MPTSTREELLESSVIRGLTNSVHIRYLGSLEAGQQLAERVVGECQGEITGYEVKASRPGWGFFLTFEVTDCEARDHVTHQAQALLQLDDIVPGLHQG